jgi:hypothetical protein
VSLFELGAPVRALQPDRRYRELRAEIEGTVAGPREIDPEIRDLFFALGS